jgi:ribosomal protein S18 acetylase RimI-like enzyme
MKNLNINIFTILMTFAAMPAWGMDYVSGLAQLAAPLLPVAATAYIFAQRNGLMPFKEEYDSEVRRVFQNSFGVVPALYNENPRPSGIYVWKKNNRIEGVLISKPLSSAETYVDYLGVDKNAQGKGIGNAMLNSLGNRLAATCPSSSCAIVLHSYTKSLGFYKKHGFTCGDFYKCRKEFASTNNSVQEKIRRK